MTVEKAIAPFSVGVQLRPQFTTFAELREAWRRADELVDSIWLWDHFFPLYRPGTIDPLPPGAAGAHFESWTLLSALALDTSHAEIGTLVTAIGYRNPDLLADMCRTVDHISSGRLVLGVGAGWFERDFTEYGYEFGSVGTRLTRLDDGLARIRRRLALLDPPPVGRLPILVGGSGPKRTLKAVARHADIWNSFDPPEIFAERSCALDGYCREVEREPSAVQRSVVLEQDAIDQVPAYLAAGATIVIVGLFAPFEMSAVHTLLEVRDAG